MEPLKLGRSGVANVNSNINWRRVVLVIVKVNRFSLHYLVVGTISPSTQMCPTIIRTIVYFTGPKVTSSVVVKVSRSNLHYLVVGTISPSTPICPTIVHTIVHFAIPMLNSIFRVLQIKDNFISETSPGRFHYNVPSPVNEVKINQVLL